MIDNKSEIFTALQCIHIYINHLRGKYYFKHGKKFNYRVPKGAKIWYLISYKWSYVLLHENWVSNCVPPEYWVMRLCWGKSVDLNIYGDMVLPYRNTIYLPNIKIITKILMDPKHFPRINGWYKKYQWYTVFFTPNAIYLRKNKYCNKIGFESDTSLLTFFSMEMYLITLE